MLIIGASDVRSLLPVADCIDIMERAMRAVSAGHASIPDRIAMPLEQGLGYFFQMPGSVAELPVYGSKMVSLHPGNRALGEPTVQGFVTLFDRATGRPGALVDAAAITARRTAAASALATRELARADARSHGLFGAGVLAVAHIDAVSCVREIDEIRVWARNHDKALKFAAEQSDRTGSRVIAVEQPEKAAACDIVSLVSNSSEPLLRGRWLNPGSHLNLVGAHKPRHRETDSDTAVRSAIYVDSLASALREAGDLLIPLEQGRIGRDDILGEIGQVLNGDVPGRRDPAQITLYKSLGIVTQDLYAAEHVYRCALEQGLGTQVDFD